jgi:hypothetical protein
VIGTLSLAGYVSAMKIDDWVIVGLIEAIDLTGILVRSFLQFAEVE